MSYTIPTWSLEFIFWGCFGLGCLALVLAFLWVLNYIILYFFKYTKSYGALLTFMVYRRQFKKWKSEQKNLQVYNNDGYVKLINQTNEI